MELPTTIGQLADLRALHLQNNNLTALPSSIGDIAQLQIIETPSNNIKTIPESIANLNKLNGLYIFDNPITDEHIQQLQSWLPNCNVQY